MYDAFFIDQSVALNRRRKPGVPKKKDGEKGGNNFHFIIILSIIIAYF